MLNYSYMFAASIIGIGYTILQTIAFVIFQIVMESHKFIIFEFYGDKVQSSYCYGTNFILAWNCSIF